MSNLDKNNFSPFEFKNIVQNLLLNPKLNDDFNVLHTFLEMSFLSFSPIEENIVKQVNVYKKSGKKKIKNIKQLALKILLTYTVRCKFVMHKIN